MSPKDDKQQNIQIELDFSSALTGEARKAGREGTEPPRVMNGTESPASTNRLMEEVCERENPKEALRRGKANKSRLGGGRMTFGLICAFFKHPSPTPPHTPLSLTYQPTTHQPP